MQYIDRSFFNVKKTPVIIINHCFFMINKIKCKVLSVVPIRYVLIIFLLTKFLFLNSWKTIDLLTTMVNYQLINSHVLLMHINLFLIEKCAILWMLFPYALLDFVPGRKCRTELWLQFAKVRKCEKWNCI